MKAKPFDFREVIDLLNESRSVSIDPDPIQGGDGRWSLHRARYKVHISTLGFEVLYLGADATKDAIDEARQYFRSGSTHVVYAPSLDTRIRGKYHREVFGAPYELIWNTREYLRSFIRDELESYLDQIRNLSPQYYIDPQVQTPSGVKGKIPNPILAALRSPRFEENTSEGVSILLGEPGQGKTYMSQFIVSELARHVSFVPVYINSAQWESMPRDHIGSLEKTIAHSFRYFDTPIAWVDGHEDRFLETTLRADLFRIVLDGFDEYILRNEGRIGVLEALEELTELARSTGARILITSRTSFWDSNVDEESFVKATQAAVYRISPFDTQHARNYFERRFGTSHPNTSRATGVFSALASRNAEFVGRGFVLKLIADLVETSADATSSQQHQGAAMRWLMTAFCDRETLRQQLPLNSAEQLTTFETFAAESATGVPRNSELLEICISDVAPRLTIRDRQDCVKRLEPHPLLTKQSDVDDWKWSQEQIGHIFLAEWICGHALNSATGRDDLKSFLQRQRLSPNDVADLASMIVDIATDRAGTSEKKGAKGFVSEVVEKILDAARLGSQASASRDGRTLATTIAMKAVDKHTRTGSSHKERAETLLEILHGPPVVEVAFTGTIARMDLRGVTFRDCRFDGVMWANVTLDEGTTFENCHFVRGLAEHTKGLGLCQFKNCTWDDDAEAMIRSASIREGRRKYSHEDLKVDLGKVVGRFVTRGGFIQSVEARNLKRGQIRNSKYADEIVDAVIGRLLAHHHISGISDGGYNVRDDSKEAVRFFASNGVFSGPVKEVYDSLLRKMNLEE